MQSTSQLVVRYALIAAAAAGAVYSLVLARASWLFEEDTATSVPGAVKLAPYNSEYLARLAAWKQPEKVQLLQRAVQLNPFDFQSLIQLGFASEFQERNNSKAERYYLRAAEVNNMFLPRWTLTNFYFRHQRSDEFFRWANATLAMTPYSPEPVFVQMWLMSQNEKRIAEALPTRPRILLPYAWFLSNNHQFAPIPPIVQRLIDAVGRGSPQVWGRDDLLAAIEDRLVADGDRGPALRVWTSMVRAGWINKSIPSPSSPLTNGNFKSPFYVHGFDWMPAQVDGLRVEQSPGEGLVRLRFNGKEPDNFQVLQEYIPVEEGRTYQLKWRIETGAAGEPSGLTWHVRPAGRAATGLMSGDLSLSEANGWQFRAPAGGTLDILTLEYARPLGHLRATGTMTLKDVSSSSSQ